MIFVIYALDAPDAKSKREVYYEAHKAFLSQVHSSGVSILISGPLMQDDGLTPVGSLFLIESPDRTKAEAFHHADPFYIHNIWQSSAITAFIKRRG